MSEDSTDTNVGLIVFILRIYVELDELFNTYSSYMPTLTALALLCQCRLVSFFAILNRPTKYLDG